MDMLDKHEDKSRVNISVTNGNGSVGAVVTVTIETPYQEQAPLKTSQNPFKRYEHIPVEAMFRKWK